MILTEKQRRAYESLLGIFAGDIRNDWGSGVHDRVACMRDIMNILGVDYELDEEACASDGRWMRDVWTGPYDDASTESVDYEFWYRDECDLGIIETYYDDLRYPGEGLTKAVETYRSKCENKS